jgi:RHS repeat-associated protein
MIKSSGVGLATISGTVNIIVLLTSILLPRVLPAAACFGPFLDYDHAVAACHSQLAPNPDSECLNERMQFTCGGVYKAVKLYRDCLGDMVTGCSFPYYSGSCPAGEWVDPETGVCESAEDNPAPAKNFGACKSAPSDHVGNPVKASTGNNYVRETDHEGFGRGILRFERTYNSGLALTDTPQPAWRHSYQRRIRETWTSSNRFRAADRPDGSSIYFRRGSSASTVWNSDADVHERLEHSTVSGVIVEYRLLLTDGTLETYDGNGVLQSITGISGNTQTLSYDTSGRLVRVESNTGEHLVLGYDAEGRHSTLADHTGRVWTYRYDADGNLEYVYYPDGSVDTHANTPYRRYHYEDAGFRAGLTGISDRVRGREERYASWTYDGLGRATASYHGPQTAVQGDRIDGVTISYDDPATRTVTDSRGDGRTYTVINQLGSYRLAGITRPGCPGCGDGDSGFSYDPETNHLLSSTVSGSVTEYGNYNGRGEPRFRIEAKGTPQERRTDYTYDSRYHGKVATLAGPSVNPSGRRISSFGYDDFGNRTSETVTGYAPDGQGGWMVVSRTTSYRFDGPLHQLSQIDGPRKDVSDITTLRYYQDDAVEGNNRARLREVEDAAGVLIRSNIQYTASGKVLSEDRPNGLGLSYTYYPGNDRLATLTRSDGTVNKVTRWTYLETGEIESITSAYGTTDATTLSFGYDAARRLTRVTDGLGNFIEYTLDTEGNREEENIHDDTGLLRKALRQTFDSYSNLDQVFRANEIMDYDMAIDGSIDQQTNGKGSVTNYSYDSLNRLLASTQDLGGLNAKTRYEYDMADRLTRVVDPNNGNTSYVYDDLGNLLKTVSPDTGTTVYTHDAAGNLKTRMDNKGQLFTYRYDALDRLTALDAPGTADDIAYEYDSCGNGTGRLCRVVMGSAVVSYSYDAFGNITTHQQAGYTFDAADRLKTITYPSGGVITYHHDAAGQVSKVDLEADGKVSTIASGITRAPFGAITSLVYGNGKALSQGYDSAYRMTDQRVPSVLELDYLSYDANGNLSQRADAFERDSSLYGYDQLDRLDSASGPFGDRGYDHDLNGNRVGLASDMTATAYSYEPASNRLSTETGWGYTQDANGNTVSRLKADGSGEGRSYRYTAHNRLASATDHVLVTTGKGKRRATTLHDMPLSVYAYNGLGQRTRKQPAGGGATSFLYGTDGALIAELDDAGAVLREYVYLNDRLLAVLEQGVAQGNPAGEEVILDDGEPGAAGTGSWVVKSSNKAHAGDYRLADGSGSSRYRWSPVLGSGSHDVYVWYVKHRSHSEAPYRIAHAGQVTTAIVDQSSGGGGWYQIGSGLEFDGSGSEYVEVSDANGKTTADAVRFVNVNSGTDEGRVTNVYYVHNDHLGTPQVMTDENATVVWRATYDPFGKALVTVSASELNVRFPGQYFDQETGLHYNHYRYYDPEIGRYLMADPIGLHGGLNTYIYALNNPVFYTDPLGLYTSASWLTGLSLGGISKERLGDMGVGEHWTIIPPAIGLGGAWWMLSAHISGVVECIDNEECGKKKRDVFNVDVEVGKRVGVGYGITTFPWLQISHGAANTFSGINDAVNFYRNEWTQKAIGMAMDPMTWCHIMSAAGLGQ